MALGVLAIISREYGLRASLRRALGRLYSSVAVEMRISRLVAAASRRRQPAASPMTLWAWVGGLHRDK